MSRRMKNTRLKRGKIEAYARLHGKQISKTFSADTPADTIQLWQAQVRLENKQGQQFHYRHTLSRDIDAYLKSLGPEKSKRRQSGDTWLKHWNAKFGDKRRCDISYEDCRQFFDDMRAKGYTPSSLNKLRTYYMSLWRWAEGNVDRCPLRQIQVFKEPDPMPRAFDPVTLWSAIEGLSETATKARLMVLYATGMRPAELGRLTPFDLKDTFVLVPSAKGGRPRAIPLTQKAKDGFALLSSLKAWGPFSNSNLRRDLYERLDTMGYTKDILLETAAGNGRIKNRYRVQPYTLRHTLATELRKNGADLADVQAILGHRDIKTTMRYAPVCQEKLADLMGRLG